MGKKLRLILIICSSLVECCIATLAFGQGTPDFLERLTRDANLWHNMPVVLPPIPDASAVIAENLSAAWLFLSGEDRRFALNPKRVAPQYSAFSCAVEMAIPKMDIRFHVCVLLDLPDAMQVTRHMFGFDEEHIDTRDVLDASTEVCNILSDAISTNMKGFETAGIPSMIDSATYEKMCKSNDVHDVYCGSNSNQKEASIINIVVLLPK
jgi:hypothetical protein